MDIIAFAYVPECLCFKILYVLYWLKNCGIYCSPLQMAPVSFFPLSIQSVVITSFPL